MTAERELFSLVRGLEILETVRRRCPIRVSVLSEELSMPLSTVYRYVKTLKAAGFLIDVDGQVMPSHRLAEADDRSDHLLRFAAPVLRRLSARTSMTAILSVRVHSAALCLDAVFAHPQHRVSYRRGEARVLYAGASALPLLAHAPESVLKEVVDGDLRRFTATTPQRAEIMRLVERTRQDGYAVSQGHMDPGMVGFGVPVLVGGRCICALSLIGEVQSLAHQDDYVCALRSSAQWLAVHLPVSVAEEGWSGDLQSGAASLDRTPPPTPSPGHRNESSGVADPAWNSPLAPRSGD